MSDPEAVGMSAERLARIRPAGHQPVADDFRQLVYSAIID